MADHILMDYIRLVFNSERDLFVLKAIKQKLYDEKEKLRGSLESEILDYEPDSIYYGYYEEEKQYFKVGAVIIAIAFLIGIIVAKKANILVGIAISIVGIVAGAVSIKLGKDKRNGRIKFGSDSNEAKRSAAEYELSKRIARNKTRRTDISRLNDDEVAINKYIVSKEEAIKEVYSVGIIHEKYRNLYSITKIFDLLDTGICNELVGVNGAYAQMRLDQIIDNQNISIHIQSEILKSNMALSNEIRRTNALLSNISSSMTIGFSEINQSINDSNQALSAISNNVEMNKFIADNITHNIEAMNSSVKYLEYAEHQRRMSEGYTYPLV